MQDTTRLCSKYATLDFFQLDLFAGIGGFRMALERNGGKCIGFSEINNDAIVVHSEAKVPEPELHEVVGSYVNPFRKAKPAQESITPKSK